MGLVVDSYRFAAGGGGPLTESFNTTDSDTLGPDLSWTELLGDIDVVSNGAEAITQTATSGAVVDSGVGSDDLYVQADVRYSQGSSGQDASPGLMARHTGTSGSDTYYYGRIQEFTRRLEIARVVSGAFTLVANGVSNSMPAGLNTMSLRMEVSGSGATVTIDLIADGGTYTLTFNDTSGSRITSGDKVGIRCYQENGTAGSGTRARWDNFEAGAL